MFPEFMGSFEAETAPVYIVGWLGGLHWCYPTPGCRRCMPGPLGGLCAWERVWEPGMWWLG